MVKKQCRFSYSDLDNSLIISCREKNENIKKNFGLGDFIFSLTGKGKIVGIQILNVSEVLSEYNIDPNLLDNLDSINLNTEIKNNCLLISLIFNSKNQQKRIPVPLMNLAN